MYSHTKAQEKSWAWYAESIYLISVHNINNIALINYCILSMVFIVLRLFLILSSFKHSICSISLAAHSLFNPMETCNPLGHKWQGRKKCGWLIPNRLKNCLEHGIFRQTRSKPYRVIPDPSTGTCCYMIAQARDHKDVLITFGMTNIDGMEWSPPNLLSSPITSP